MQYLFHDILRLCHFFTLREEKDIIVVVPGDLVLLSELRIASVLFKRLLQKWLRTAYLNALTIIRA